MNKCIARVGLGTLFALALVERQAAANKDDQVLSQTTLSAPAPSATQMSDQPSILSDPSPSVLSKDAVATAPTLNCFQDLSAFKQGGLKKNDKRTFSGTELLEQACQKVQVLDTCTSVEGRKIYHYDRKSEKVGGKKILVFSLIHGDEHDAGSVSRLWIERLEAMSEPRNSWRLIPILNPDGVVAKTRTNRNNIDLNRNFPTKDWESLAIQSWRKTTHSNPRRFPGNLSGSEPEVKCALRHIEEFKPDFLVSIHTPLRTLDFDGPKLIKPPQFSYLPWKSLGHLPGSLGRYMWFERKTPVLTLELRETLPSPITPFEELQDMLGTLVTKQKDY